MNEKKDILETVDTLSNDAVYAFYLNSKLQNSKNDIKNGKVMTVEESKERMRKKYANFNVK